MVKGGVSLGKMRRGLVVYHQRHYYDVRLLHSSGAAGICEEDEFSYIFINNGPLHLPRLLGR